MLTSFCCHVLFFVCVIFLHFICEDISLQFEERITSPLILSSQFASVFYYILEELIGDLACVLNRDRSSCVSVCILYVLCDDFDFSVYMFRLLGWGCWGLW